MFRFGICFEFHWTFWKEFASLVLVLLDMLKDISYHCCRRWFGKIFGRFCPGTFEELIHVDQHFFFKWMLQPATIYRSIWARKVRQVHPFFCVKLLMAEILHDLIGSYPIIYKVLCIPGGAGFQPSTESLIFCEITWCFIRFSQVIF